MQAPDDSLAWPMEPEQWGVMRLVRAFDVMSFCIYLRFETIIRGVVRVVPDVVPMPRHPLAVKAHTIVKHDRALDVFQAIEDAREAA